MLIAVCFVLLCLLHFSVSLCRASSSKLYFEPLWTSHAAVYKEYVVQCREKGVTFMSRKTFSEVFSSMNIALYSPKKDQCDICTMHSVGNISDMEHYEHTKKKRRHVLRSQGIKKKQLMIRLNSYILWILKL